LGVGSIAEGSCCLGDSPYCGCFVDTGAWDPNGPDIQDIAHDTVGTRESCLANGGSPITRCSSGSTAASWPKGSPVWRTISSGPTGPWA